MTEKKTAKSMIIRMLTGVPGGKSARRLFNDINAEWATTQENISSALTSMKAKREIMLLPKEDCPCCGHPLVLYVLPKKTAPHN